MWETWKEMFRFFQAFYNNGIIIYVYIISFFSIILFGGKDLRKMIGWPVLLLMIIVFNPIFYYYIWQKCFHYGYWRVFWLFPVTFVISMATIIWFKKIKEQKKQILFLFMLLLLIGCNGKNAFSKQLFYTDTQNIYKLPQEAIDVADALLELDTEPKVVMSSELYSYIRQYSTDIKMMYGRNVEGYINGNNQEGIAMVENLEKSEKPDWIWVVETMRQNQCKYLVMPEKQKDLVEEMKLHSFILLKQVDGYDIFELV